MSPKSKNVIAVLERLSELYIVAGDAWRARAYADAVQNIRAHGIDIATVKDPTTIDGIGRGIAAKIKEVVKTGTCAKLTAMEQKAGVPAAVLGELCALHGVGPKTAARLYQEHGVASLDDLEDRLTSGDILDAKLAEALHDARLGSGRLARERVAPHVERLLKSLRGVSGVLKAEAAGSYRRHRSTVGDLDILVAVEDDAARARVRRAFGKHGKLESSGQVKMRLTLKGIALSADLLIVEPESWGAAMCYFTGSKEHNVALRGLAKGRGMLVNEYGIYDVKSGKRIGGEHESDLYNLLGLPYVKPEDREGYDLSAAA